MEVTFLGQEKDKEHLTHSVDCPLEGHLMYFKASATTEVLDICLQSRFLLKNKRWLRENFKRKI